MYPRTNMFFVTHFDRLKMYAYDLISVTLYVLADKKNTCKYIGLRIYIFQNYRTTRIDPWHLLRARQSAFRAYRP